LSRYAMIVAAAPDLTIGKGGGIPWDSPQDRAHFRRVTAGKPVIMGRRTYESIGRPLPDRKLIVVTSRRFDGCPEGVTLVRTVEEARYAAEREEPDEIVVAGGAGIYGDLAPICDTIYYTRVRAEGGGDVMFPLDPLGDDRAWSTVARWEWREGAPQVEFFVLRRLTHAERQGRG